MKATIRGEGRACCFQRDHSAYSHWQSENSSEHGLNDFWGLGLWSLITTEPQVCTNIISYRSAMLAVRWKDVSASISCKRNLPEWSGNATHTHTHTHTHSTPPQESNNTHQTRIVIVIVIVIVIIRIVILIKVCIAFRLGSRLHLMVDTGLAREGIAVQEAGLLLRNLN